MANDPPSASTSPAPAHGSNSKVSWFGKRWADVKPFLLDRDSWVRVAIVPILEFITWIVLIGVVITTIGRVKTVENDEFVDALKGLAWPFVVMMVLLVLRRPASAFLAGLSGRIAKISVLNIELELATIKTSVVTSPELSALQQTVPLAVAESSTRIFFQIQEETLADYVVIDIGGGEEWITSRLFIIASLFQRMRGIRCIVFLEGEGPNKGTFLGTANPEAVRWRLAKTYPWLEIALLTAFVATFPEGPIAFPSSNVLVRNERGSLDIQSASAVASSFIESLQSNVEPTFQRWTWTQIGDPQLYWERAEWLTRDSLRTMLGDSLNEARIGKLEERTNDEAVRTILALPGPFVALIRAGRFDQLIDQQALLKALARQVQLSGKE